jgi:hypothetical protein
VTWNRSDAELRAAADYLAGAADRSDVVLSYDPARLYLMSGNPGVAPPFDPDDVIGQVVDAYDVRWVVVTLEGEDRDPLGLWDGAASFLPDAPAFEAPGVRVFAVPR